MGWNVLGESLVGTSHRTRNSPCQDAIRHLQYGELDECLAIVVADGAGSASHSDFGSSFVCGQVVRHIKENATETLFTKDGMIALVSEIRQSLKTESERLNTSLRELACTAIIALIAPGKAVFCQIGDGGIVIDSCSGYRVVFWPEPSEYANATDFLTDDSFANTLRYEIVEEPINEVAIFTDGLQRLALDFTNRLAFEGFFKPLFNALQSTSSEQLVEPFRNFLDSDRVNERTDDDKSLVLAVRKI